MALRIETSNAATNMQTNNQNYQTYNVKKGDSLWKIAKNRLGTKATNQEIANYTNEMARLNNLDTEKKRNTIFVDDKLYLPEQAKKARAQQRRERSTNSPATSSNPATPAAPAKHEKPAAPVKPAAPANPKAADNTPATKKTKEAKEAKDVKKSEKASEVKKTDKPKVAKTNAEKGFEKASNNILNNKLYIQKAYLGSYIKSSLYHVSKSDEKGNVKNLIGSYKKDENGKFYSFSFDGETKINEFGYDYEIRANGNIYKAKDLNTYGVKSSPVQGKVPAETLQKMIEKVDSQIKE